MDYYTDRDTNRLVSAIMLQAGNASIISVWANAILVEELDPFDAELKFPGLNVQCGNTVKRASLGDYVIKHGDGTYNVMPQFDFLSKYTLIEG